MIKDQLVRLIAITMEMISCFLKRGRCFEESEHEEAEEIEGENKSGFYLDKYLNYFFN